VTKRNTKILILEKATSFRTSLKSLCSEVGRTWIADDMKSASILLTRHSFDLQLLNWEMIQSDPSIFGSMTDPAQPPVCRIALVKAPRLNEVVTAMKSGMDDVFWDVQDASLLKEKIKDALVRKKNSVIIHSCVSQLVESLVRKSLDQKLSLFRARKEFSKVFLAQILKHQKISRTQLADLMNITPRTLYRYLMR
jgi:DNA-binding NtrC family response regulator